MRETLGSRPDLSQNISPEIFMWKEGPGATGVGGGEGLYPRNWALGGGSGLVSAAGGPSPSQRGLSDRLCVGQRRTSVRCQPRTGWTAATPRSRPSSATIVAAASTPASLACPGASSPCRKQVSQMEHRRPFGPREAASTLFSLASISNTW